MCWNVVGEKARDLRLAVDRIEPVDGCQNDRERVGSTSCWALAGPTPISAEAIMTTVMTTRGAPRKLVAIGDCDVWHLFLPAVCREAENAPSLRTGRFDGGLQAFCAVDRAESGTEEKRRHGPSVGRSMAARLARRYLD